MLMTRSARAGKRGFIQLVANIPAMMLIAGEILVLVLILWLLRPNPVINVETGTVLDSEARANMLLTNFLKSQTQGERLADVIAQYADNRNDGAAKAKLEKESKKLFLFEEKNECYVFEIADDAGSVFKAKDDRPECTENALVTFRTAFTETAAVPLDGGRVVTAKLAMQMAESLFKKSAGG